MLCRSSIVQALSNYVEVEEEEDIEVGCLGSCILQLRVQSSLDRFHADMLQLSMLAGPHSAETSRV